MVPIMPYSAPPPRRAATISNNALVGTNKTQESGKGRISVMGMGENSSRRTTTKVGGGGNDDDKKSVAAGSGPSALKKKGAKGEDSVDATATSTLSSKQREKKTSKTAKEDSDGSYTEKPEKGGAKKADDSDLGRWTMDEKNKIVAAFETLGLDFNSVAAAVGTKSEAQCKEFYRFYNKKMSKSRF